MAYNQLYPYSQGYQQQQPTTIWVAGIEEAQTYPVGLGATVLLWDRNRQSIYIKSCDAYGMQSMTVLDFTIRKSQSDVAITPPDPAPAPAPAGPDLQSMQDQIDELKAMIESLKKPVRTARKENTDE